MFALVFIKLRKTIVMVKTIFLSHQYIWKMEGKCKLGGIHDNYKEDSFGA